MEKLDTKVPETPTSDPAICNKEGCENAAGKMSCPTCVKMNLPLVYYCSQDCFKQAWSVHKKTHPAPVRYWSPPASFEGYKFTGPLRPGKVTEMKKVNTQIEFPDYGITSYPNEEMQSKADKNITVHTAKDIATLRETALLARKALDVGARKIAPGVTTAQIDDAVHDFIVSNGAYPSPLNYFGFPKSLCTSVNEVICHGIPDDRPLKEGDIVNLDITVYYLGFHADLNETFAVGKCDQESLDLIENTWRCLEAAIAICKPGVMYRTLGNIIGEVAQEKGLSVVKSYCGHGIGKLFHTCPNISHYPKNKTQGIMQKGHVFTVEPMINQGLWKDVTWPDNWTAVTADGRRSAQFEHTMLVTETGVELLTARLPDSPPLSFTI